MYISIDENSEEAFYLQIRNQVILAIAMNDLQAGQNLPSVRDMAEKIGINMHTVHKAYGLLREEGYLRLDRRRGAVIAAEIDEFRAKVEVTRDLKFLIAQAICKGIEKQTIHDLVEEIYDGFQVK